MAENSSSRNAKNGLPLLFLLLILAAFAGVSSLIEQLGYDKETTKVFIVVTIVGGGLLLVTLCSTIAFLPLLLAQNGHTGVAQSLALFNSKFMEVIFPNGSESSGLFMTVAHAARSNGDYETAQKFASKAIDASVGFNERVTLATEVMQGVKNRPASAAGLTLTRGQIFKIPEAKLLQAWNFFELGQYEQAEQLVRDSVTWMLSAIEEETFPKVEWDKSAPKGFSDRLNLNVTEKMAEQTAELTVKTLMPRNFALLSNAYELLGLLAAKKGDGEASRVYWRNAYDVLVRNNLTETSHMVSHLENRASANLLLHDARAARKDAESARELARKHSISPALRSSVLTVLGESYSQLNMKQEAEETLKSALALRMRLYPEKHPLVKQTKKFLADHYEKIGKHENAVKQLQ